MESSGNNEILLSAKSLKKRFGNRQVLDGVDLDIRAGHIVAIIGRSGEGKSVLLKHLAGLIQPDSGSVSVEGREITNLDERELLTIRRHFGFMFQGGALFDSMTVAENVAFPLEQRDHHSPTEIDDLVTEYLERVDMLEHASKLPGTLSGGMVKRVAAARALITRPKAVLCDEPTSGLDPIGSDSIGSLICRMRDDFGVTPVVVTHDLSLLHQISDLAVFLQEGKIRFSGTARELAETSAPEVVQFLSGKSDTDTDPS